MMPQSASKDEKARPGPVMGTISPYPRDVMVSMAHHEHVPMLENTAGCDGFSRKKLQMFSYANTHPESIL
ncbi:hypothetical protein KXD40_003130 [Peronospora effusa]|uniref:Uncharacterized protein n=1 Tax=Peronospora effusa TaxID=542832 RepID=A0A3R8CLJ9_9STRA|nr:hypothetical protein DD237_005044 [Peronospora effusa]UIZ29803.1 hypothetical protein KXD40_003130 [Peronospora effusa]